MVVRKMLNFVVSKKWFNKIKIGEKKIEFREVKPFWTKKLVLKNSELIKTNFGSIIELFPKECILRCGYTKEVLFADIDKIEIWNSRENDLSTNPVYAIYLKNVRGIK